MKVHSNTSGRDTTDNGLVSLLRAAITEPRRIGVIIAALLIAGGMMFTTIGSASAQSDVLDYVQSLFGGLGIRAAEDVVISPDGKYVYALGEYDNAVVLFQREEPSGELSYIATYVNGENNVKGLLFPTALNISDDGLNLYALGEDSLVVFTRNVTTGALTYVETMKNGQDNVENMYGPDALDVSPDGANVYVVGDVALTIFERDAGDQGKLTFVESFQGNTKDVIFQFRDVVVPTNQTVYASSYDFDSVYVLARNVADKGRVTVSQTVKEGEGGVSGISGVEKLAATVDGKSLYATGSISSTLAVFDRDANGKLTFLEFHTNGKDGVDGIGGARAIAASADGTSVYVGGTNNDALAGFTRAGDGRLTFGECFTSKTGDTTCQKNVAGLKDPSAIAIDPSGKDLYVSARESDSVDHFVRNTGSGQLTFASVLYNEDGGEPGMGGARNVTVSPDGKHAYVVSERDDSIVVYGRSLAADGALTFIEYHPNRTGGIKYMSHPTSVAVSPDGGSVYVSSDGGDSIGASENGTSDSILGSVTVFSRDAETGKLTYVETQLNGESGVSGLAGAWDVTVSPDNKNVYVTGLIDGTLASFSRDATTGKLKQVQLQMEGVSGVTGLAGAAGLAISDDGKHIYVAGSTSDAVAVFRRDGAKGELSWVESLFNNQGSVIGLNGPIAVDVSPDGESVYAAALSGERIVAFSRDITTGRLQFVHAFSGAAALEASDADFGVIRFYWDLQVSSDNKYVFAVRWTFSGSSLDAVGEIVTFARQAGSGLLSREQVLQNDEGEIRGMRAPVSVAVSDDGVNVYLTSPEDSSVLTFKVVGSAPYTDRGWMPWLSKAK